MEQRMRFFMRWSVVSPLSLLLPLVSPCVALSYEEPLRACVSSSASMDERTEGSGRRALENTFHGGCVATALLLSARGRLAPLTPLASPLLVVQSRP